MTAKDNKFNHKDGVTLKEYFDSKFNDLKDYIDIKFSASDKATKLAQDTLDVRLESMNEFRNSMKDQASSFVTRQEHDVIKAKYDADIRMLRESLAMEKGKASQNSVIIAYLIAITGIIIGVISLVVRTT